MYLKMKANEARQDLAPPSFSPQDSGMYSQHIDVQDEFFSQEGFTYTGFLLGAMTGSANNHEPYAQDSKSKDTKSELTQENDANTSSTLLLQQDDDPWNLTMFDNLELDQVHKLRAMEVTPKDKIVLQHLVMSNMCYSPAHLSQRMHTQMGTDRKIQKEKKQHVFQPVVYLKTFSI